MDAVKPGDDRIVQPRELPNHWRAVWLLFGVPVALLWSVSWIVHLNPATYTFGDFAQDWISARCVRDGRPVYSPLEDVVPEYLGVPNDPVAQPLKYNAHPPVSVLLLLPLAWLSHPAAKLTWNIISLLCVALAAALVLGKRGFDVDRWYGVPLGVLIVVSTPIAGQIRQGQYNGVLLLLVVVAWLADRNQRPILAGAMVGLAGAIKLFPLLLIVYFLAQRRWSAVLAVLATFLALHIVALGVFGIEAFETYVTVVLPAVNEWRASWLNSSFTGFWSRLFDSNSPSIQPIAQLPLLARGLILASAAITTALIAWRSYRANSRESRDLAFGSVIVAMLLISPTTWDHYWLLLMLPLAILWFAAKPSLPLRLGWWSCVTLLLIVRPHMIWGLAFPSNSFSGRHDLNAFIDAVAQPWQSLTVASYSTYSLLVCLLLALFARAFDNRDHRSLVNATTSF